MRAIVASSLAAENRLPRVQHELPLPDRERGDLYLRKTGGKGPDVIIELKYVAVDHFTYEEPLSSSLPRKGDSIINWEPEQKRAARAFLASHADRFDDMEVNYNRRGVKTTLEWRKAWEAEAKSRVASFRKAYGGMSALRVLSVTVFPTGHTRVDLVADVPGEEKDAASEPPKAARKADEGAAKAKKAPKKPKVQGDAEAASEPPEAALKTHESSATAKKAPKKPKAPKKSSM